MEGPARSWAGPSGLVRAGDVLGLAQGRRCNGQLALPAPSGQTPVPATSHPHPVPAEIMGSVVEASRDNGVGRRALGDVESAAALGLVLDKPALISGLRIPSCKIRTLHSEVWEPRGVTALLSAPRAGQPPCGWKGAGPLAQDRGLCYGHCPGSREKRAGRTLLRHQLGQPQSGTSLMSSNRRFIK